MVTLNEARKLAEETARKHLKPLLKFETMEWLSDIAIECENCWIFLKINGLVFIDEEASAWADCAFAVSKWGEVRLVADHQGDIELLSAYGKLLSTSFKENYAR
jgi:hypothetical protein